MTFIARRRLTNGHLNGGAHGPPPSSMLAAHFAPVNGNGSGGVLPDFDKSSFDLLLEESLGQDEYGEPNLGIDTGTNHKLICVLFKAGIDRALGQVDNPFNAYSAGRDGVQIQLCLDVIKLALERSPRVLFVPTTYMEGNPRPPIPLYAWLIPKLLALLSISGEAGTESNEKIQEILAVALSAEGLCSTAGSACYDVSDFFHACSEALLQDLERSECSSVALRSGCLGNEQEAFAQALARLQIDINPELAALSIQIPGALVAAMAVTTCRVAALTESRNGYTSSNLRFASQILDHLERIWHFLIDSIQDADTGVHSLLNEFFSTLNRLRPATFSPNLSMCKQRCTLLWAASFADCVDSIYSLTEGDLREPLKNALAVTLSATTHDGAFSETLRELLDSRLDIVNDEGQLDGELHVSDD